MKQILIETQTFSPKNPLKLTEGKSPTGNLLVEGVLATAEIKNGNGRYYSRDLWEREIDKYTDSIKHNRALGELDHPESQIINLKNVSHNIKKIWWNGDNIIGTIEILPTPSGNILEAFFKNGIPVGVSSRGMGSLKQMGEILEVQDDFELLCWDFVSTPSNPGSYMKEKGMMNESKNNLDVKNYQKVNSIITDILCANGSCPIF
jgi:hypothetical protein